MRKTLLRILHAALLTMLVILVLIRPGSPAATGQSYGSGWDDKAEYRWVEATLKSLSLRERVGQLVVGVASGEYAKTSEERLAEVRRQVAEQGVGGLIVRGGSPAEVAALTNEMQRLAKVPLLVAADYERGLRMQMKAGTPFTYSMGVAAAGDPQAAYRQGRITAEEARAIGVNWLFSPVADINNNPDNPVISIRSFGEDPRRVAEFVAAYVRGVRAGGALSTLKHFPGHGDTAVDTHIGLAAIRADRARLDRLELVPFRAGIAQGADAVMTAHVAVLDVTGDGLPASLSARLTTEVLRGELKFSGLVVTDSLSMGAITKGFPGAEGALRAIKAGADVALTPPDVRAAVDALEQAVTRGEITEARIDESVRRVLRAKYRVGLSRRREVDAAAVASQVERAESVREAQRVAENSLTLLRNMGGVLPLDAGRAASALFVVVAADEDPEEGRTFVPEVLRRVKGARIMRAEPRAGADVYEAIMAEASKAGLVVVATFVKRAASKGTVALPEAQAAFVRRLVALGKPSVVIGFGSPYLIRQFAEAHAYVAAYAIEDVAQAAAARALFGEVDFRGRLPVRVPGLFELGAGIQLSGVRKSVSN